MKAFYKWWKKVMLPRKKLGENIYEGDCRLAFKAALEWVLREITLSPSGLKSIQRELEDILMTIENEIKRGRS